MSYKEYKIKRRYGIGCGPVKAWSGGSQGDETSSNDSKMCHGNEWLIYNYTGIDPTDQKAIDAEYARRVKKHEEYIAKLKDDGLYGKEYETSIHLMPNPLFDEPVQRKVPMDSWKMTILDLSNSK